MQTYRKKENCNIAPKTNFLGNSYPIGSGLSEKNVQKPDCVFYHCDIMIFA